MTLIFKPEFHEYESIGEDKIDWLGVTTFVSHFKQPFDAVNQSVRSSLKKNSKWFGIPPEEIQRIWTRESTRATDLGHWYHDQRESDVVELDTIERSGISVPVVKPIYKEGIKYAPPQVLLNGIYPEHLVYLKSIGVCGQSDRVEVVNNVCSISDYKSNKELKLRAYSGWEGPTMMQDPISHLEDCHIVHYGLQLSLYLYIILKHNPNLKPGKLIIDHIVFEKEGDDKFGYPITKLDKQGNPVLKELKQYEVPYYKAEVNAMLKYLKENKHLIKKKP